MEDNSISSTYQAALQESSALAEKLKSSPQNYRMLTGDRPTGRLHIGHLFGSLENRVALQELGVESFVLVADLQVNTDREKGERIQHYIHQLALEYLAVGIDPEKYPVHIFVHSQVPELNQLFIPFLSLVSQSELERNPTTKDELSNSKLETISASLLTYPVHQAADILFCHGNVVPVGKDQLPHIELTRNIARRFNQRYSSDKDYFRRPQALLSEAPMIMGLDGSAKMSKSRNNTVELCATADETAAAIKKAKTDGERQITYEPQRRPEVANLLQLISLCSKGAESPTQVAERIGDGGAAKLKSELTEQLNSHLAPIRARRAELEKDPAYIEEVLRKGCAVARERAAKTLTEVNRLMGTCI